MKKVSHDTLMQLKGISKVYDMGEVQVTALKDTSLDLYQGELLVILGPSGSGKSTLLNIIGGMDKASSGSITFEDKNLADASDDQLTAYRRNQVGFVFQFYNLIPDLTARENVELAARLVKNPLSAEESLYKVGLVERMDHFPSQMSGGEQQRVAIARAIVKKPRLLLCDEPTGALDFQTGISVLSLLKEINRESGCTVIIITHNMAIGAMADRVVKMRSGEIAGIEKNNNPQSPEGIEW
ncbi:MAG: ABC transporter ATP-binding protein [Syntrophomonadaceae bacterium]|jgi:putative ABC transport system ATP-binding protein